MLNHLILVQMMMMIMICDNFSPSEQFPFFIDIHHRYVLSAVNYTRAKSRTQCRVYMHLLVFLDDLYSIDKYE